MDLAYDLLEDRRTIDVIITKSVPRRVKMAESFKNLDNILRDWPKDKVQKVSVAETLNSFEKKNDSIKFISLTLPGYYIC